MGPAAPKTKNSSNCSHSENGCKEEFLAQKAHEMSCIYQKVSCPQLDCKELIIFKEMDIHLDQAHKIQRQKANEEWDFEGTKDELLVKNICSHLQSTIFPSDVHQGRLFVFQSNHAWTPRECHIFQSLFHLFSR